MALKELIQAPLRAIGYEIRRTNNGSPPLPVDLDPEFKQLYIKCQNYTMTSPERMYALWQAVRYVCKNKIPGNFVECGVWRGGSSMLMALTLKSMGETSRKIFLYDTFAGMSTPTSDDVNHSGGSAAVTFSALQRPEFNEWAYASLDDVKTNLCSTGYPEANLHFIKGKVEETIPSTTPGSIALLRLDTDWYESTKHELIHLYPVLVNKGVLILDDYGHWLGARKAVDEYFSNFNVKPLLNRIDYTGRISIKLDG